MDIAANHYQGDKEFMDGNTDLNYPGAEVPLDNARIGRFDNNADSDNVIAWPRYEARKTQGYSMSNFDLNYCGLRAAMCCYVDNKNEADFTSNTQACYHNITEEKASSHLVNGLSFFDFNDPTHCIGFSWSQDENNPSNFLKGNALYDISYKYHYETGYNNNVPGAPMCACIEQMPVVEDAKCRKVDGSAEYTFKYQGSNSLEHVTTNAAVTYEDCGGTLRESYLGPVDDLPKLQERLVGAGQCSVVKDAWLNERLFYVPGESGIFDPEDETKWEKVHGLGLDDFPFLKDNDSKYPNFWDKYEEDFRALIAASPNQIIRRTCIYCWEGLKDIYIKRVTDIPDTCKSLLYNLLANYDNKCGIPGTDFKLYSTYEDAINSTNEWAYYRFKGGVGFPGESGPVSRTYNNWNDRDRHLSNRHPGVYHAYYVEKPLV